MTAVLAQGVSAFFDITGMVASYTTPQNSFTYSYDEFDRLTRKLGSMHSVQYTYVAGTQSVATYTISRAIGSPTVYAYTYDALGYITSIKKNGTNVSVYEYDALGRLICESDSATGTAWVYTYDNAGNILWKRLRHGCGSWRPYGYFENTPRFMGPTRI